MNAPNAQCSDFPNRLQTRRRGTGASQSGIGKLTLLVFGSVTGVALFCAYHILPFYYYYYELLNQMEAVIRVADVETDRSIRTKLLYHIKKMQIPADPEDLKIVRDGQKMKISLPYKEVFFVSYRGKDYDIHTFVFDAYAEGKY